MNRPLPLWRWGGIASLVLIFVLIAALSGGAVATQLNSQSAASRQQAQPAADASTAGPGSANGGAMPGDARINTSAKPAAGWTARDPVLPPADSPTVHNVSFEVIEKSVEVAPGITQHMWTFNGTTPGPILRGKLGDTFNITITNHGFQPHSIDFHASMVSPTTQMRSIAVGKSLVYSFVANHSGIFMYHCGVSPTLLHIGEGMYGAVVIDPPGLAPVDHEYVLIQSELYLGRNGGIEDYNKMLAANWDGVVFNGYYNQYVYSPIKVGKNQRIRVWVMNDGPSENSSWHVVGTIFDTVFKEGAYTLRPDASAGGSQALDLMPAQGGFVEFTLPADGNYTFITHKFSNVVKGAAGIFQVGNAAPGG
jgi:nitrite reductase (NO-forming)